MRQPSSNRKRIETIIRNAHDNKPVSRDDILFILKLNNKNDLESLFAGARSLRKQFFGDNIFLYGFLYISTYCRNNCNFCYYRECNLTSLRYRKEESETLTAAASLADSGVHLIDLTMGEDPRFHNDGESGYNGLHRLLKKVSAIGLPVMVSPGVVPESTLSQLASAGASWYACYQETHNRSLFNELRPGQNFDVRFKTKQLAHKHGLLTEEGMLVGVGESDHDIADSFRAISVLDADQVRVMNFVPQKGTPMENRQPPDPMRELVIIAAMRLAFPHRLIPATLDVEGLDGLKGRLDAGANVVTSIVPPGKGLAGVAQGSLDIDVGRRSTQQVLPILEDCGLEPAPLDFYLNWITNRRKRIQEFESDKINEDLQQIHPDNDPVNTPVETG